MLQCPKHTTRILSYFRHLAGTSVVAVALFGAGFGPARAADDPTGDWKVADGVANIRVAECNGAMWGVVVWEKKAGGIDRNNPDALKRSRPTLGMPILLDMKKQPGKEAWEGQVYNAKDGKLYDSTIKLASPDELEIQGCVLGFLCGGETWTRVSGPIPSSPSNNPTAKGAPKANMARVTPSPKSSHRTTGQKTATPRTTTTTPTAQADPVGDICLLPDIARPTH